MLLKTLPNKPGVYHHLDEEGQILYVGKAKNLKKRVASYFTKKHDSARLATLVRKVRDIHIIVTETELEALLLENTLIKKHQPRYNINLKDDKTYPWICIKNERFPRVFSTRRKLKDGSEYYGPYASVRVMNTLLDLVRQTYPIRTCTLNLSAASIEQGKHRVCLEYQIGNCLGPCEDKQSEADYMADIEGARQLIKGQLNAAKKSMHGQMMAHAQRQEFELAQQAKERLERLERYQAKSTVVTANMGEWDVFSIVSDADMAYVNFLMIREDAVVQSHTKEIRKRLEEADEEILQMLIPEIRAQFGSECQNILLPMKMTWLDGEVQVTVPQRGQKAKVLAMSERNAREARLERLKNMSIVDPDRHVNRIMKQMQQDLRLQLEPRHIECFDNSNTMGKEPVSACVVFKNGKPSKRDYRHFNVRTVEGPDDYATMREVITRRYQRLMEESQELPQLIIIDGGRGQLSAAVEALEALGLRGEIAIIGIAKRLEEIYYPEDPMPLYLDKRSETLKVIQQARNEAHRFSITHHRKRRGKTAIHSELEGIPGVGPSTIDMLLKAYRSVKSIKAVPESALAEVIGKHKAKLVYQALHAPPKS